MDRIQFVRTIVARARALTMRQFLSLGVGMTLAAAGFAGLVLGASGPALGSILLLQVLVVALVLLATHRISSRVAAVQVLGPELAPARSRRRGRDSGMLSVLGACRFYARSNRGRQSELVSQLVLDRSLDGRDILAHAASRGNLDFKGVCVLLECFRSPSKRGTAKRAVRGFDRESLLSLARLVYRQDALAGDTLDAITLFELVKVVFGRKALSLSDREWLVSALLQERRADEALAWMEQLDLSAARSPNYHLLLANATNPYVHRRADGDEDAWLAHLNHMFVCGGLEPLRLEPGSSPAFSRMRVDVADAVEDGPLVSVIVPVYRAGPEIDVAIGSILAQTWRCFELIVVVDGGPADTSGAIERWARLDERIRVIRCAKNRGTYTARNIGLDAARGEFVTCHDGDDWSHPRKLEIQARHLVANRGCIANQSLLLRVTGDLEIRHRSPSVNLAHAALISLMFRREPVMARIGYWDTVRKMGDAEFIRRMELAFDQQIGTVGEAPLYFALHDAGSLSGSDMHRGFMHPERQIYRARYREWHKRIAAGHASAWMPNDPKARPFPAPASFLPVSPGEQEAFDVVFVSEIGFTGGNVHSLVHEMTICIEAGLRVGLVHARNVLFTHLARREPLPALAELLASGAVTELAITNDVRARLVIVRWPACFQYASSLASGIRAERAIVVANHPPYERHQDRHSYEIGTVSRNVRAVFGVEPEWSPQSQTIRRMLAPQLAHGRLLDVDWVGVLCDAPQAAKRQQGPVSTTPVIGRHSRDHHLKWPGNRETLLKVYPVDGPVRVKVLGGVDSLVNSGVLSAEDVARWQVHPFGSLPPMEFLQTVDFFVYYHHDDWVEAYGRVIMEAMFAGTVVVLPPSFKPVFGDAALYAEPDEVQFLVMEYYRDWQRYDAQSRLGLAYVQENCTPLAYRRRLAALGLEVALERALGAA